MSGCGKIPFESRADANGHARYRRKHGHMTGTPRAYKCACGAWHLTSLSKSEARRRFPRSA